MSEHTMGDGRVSPAVRAEGWAAHLDSGGNFKDRQGESWTRHAHAAFTLHDQPFGFTWDDVEVLRFHAEGQRDDSVPIDDVLKVPRSLHAIADRIEALLPPKRTEELLQDMRDGPI